MSTLRALAFLSWALAAMGVAMYYDARSPAPGGILPHSSGWVVVSVVLASASACAAVGLHVAELLSWRRKGRKRKGRAHS